MLGNGFAHQESQTSSFAATAVAADDLIVGTGRDLGGVSPLCLLDSRYSFALRTPEGQELVKLVLGRA
ncbi:unnamed protein product [Dibothriocephalus latus]|uniref:Uncharacterized protein n=1 Tax=Dibothriocephalus latus TaxID=60516 RepID=A0A3P7N2U8_DIBLA|nr:unnamed protein product [Dibothriocephalus latus]